MNRYIEKQKKTNKLCKDSKTNKPEPKQDETNETHADTLILGMHQYQYHTGQLVQYYWWTSITGDQYYW